MGSERTDISPQTGPWADAGISLSRPNPGPSPLEPGSGVTQLSKKLAAAAGSCVMWAGGLPFLCFRVIICKMGCGSAQAWSFLRTK